MGPLAIVLLTLAISCTTDVSAYTGKDTSNFPKDCVTVSLDNAITWNGTGGVFDIYPGNSGRKIQVYCDLTTDGGGWTIFQRRMDGSVDFYRSWADYVIGFGDPAGEFWMGLEKLHSLTTIEDVELRIDMEDWEGKTAYAYYTTFSVGDASTQYQLNVGGHSGGTGDSLSYHDGMKFSTFDYENDLSYSSDCAKRYKGGWWYNACRYCNLNGIYYVGGNYSSEYTDGAWWDVGWYSMKFIEMKFRPKL